MVLFLWYNFHMEQGIRTEQLLKKYTTYRERVQAIEQEVACGTLVPIKSSGSNEKNPPLYNRYRIVKPKKDTLKYKIELMESLPVPLDPSYYLHHFSQYEKDRPYVLKMIRFFSLADVDALLSEAVSFIHLHIEQETLF